MKTIKEKIIEKIESMLRPGILIVLVWVLCLNSVVALSDPINQSMTEFNNMTRVDNVLELAVEMNAWVGGLFGITILILVFAVSFIMTLFYRNDIGKALLFSSFISVITSILLFVVDLVPDQAVFFSVPLFLIALVYAVVNK